MTASSTDLLFLFEKNNNNHPSSSSSPQHLQLHYLNEKKKKKKNKRNKRIREKKDTPPPPRSTSNTCSTFQNPTPSSFTHTTTPPPHRERVLLHNTRMYTHTHTSHPPATAMPYYELGVKAGRAPPLLRQQILTFYELYGRPSDLDIAANLADDYAGREAQLRRQLESRYPDGKGFFATWDAVVDLLRLRDAGRVADVAALFSRAQKTGVAALLRSLQAEYGTAHFVERGLLERGVDDFSCHREHARHLLRRHDPTRLNALDTLMRTHAGEEAALVSRLAARYTGARSPPPAAASPAATVEALAGRRRVIEAQGAAVHEYAAAVRREAQRGDAAREQVAPLLAAAVTATRGVGCAAARAGDGAAARGAEEALAELRGMADLVGLDLRAVPAAAAPGRPAATHDELRDMHGDVADLRAAAAANRRTLQRLATFAGVDEAAAAHVMRENKRPAKPPAPHADLVLQSRAGAPLGDREAVELLALFVGRGGQGGGAAAAAAASPPALRRV